jgi:hypothetical protein
MLTKIRRAIQNFRLFSQIRQFTREVVRDSELVSPDKPIVFFNASTRLDGLSLNAAFSLISSWGVQLSGRQVYHFACRSGMSHCVLAAGIGDPTDPPPCQKCIRYTDMFTAGTKRIWFDYKEDLNLKELLEGKSVDQLIDIEYKNRPLGRLVVTSARWILRRHNLLDDDVTRYLMSEFILSANSIAEGFGLLLEEVDPEVVVVYNGLLYPEAVVRWICNRNNIRVISHEVNLQPYSAFFTEKEATSYRIDIPDDFQLSADQNKILDRYLEKRFEGDFEMAGIKFWPSMNSLSDDFINMMDQYKNLVPVFTNVIFDTSQAHSNTLFSTMFDWLDYVVDTAIQYPNTFFIIRAHPDESRQGKSSQESVLGWSEEQNLDQISNLMVIGPDETISSYELIQRSKFTMVYNSSIGLEATLLSVPVLCAGLARYTHYPTVYYPETRQAYEDTLESFLLSDNVDFPEYFLVNARKFLYYQLYRSSLPFSEFLKEGSAPGYVHLKDFNLDHIKPGGSKVIETIVAGILKGEDFSVDVEDLLVKEV